MKKGLKTKTIASLALVHLTFFTTPAQAAILYSSIWSGTTINFGINSTYWAAHKFYSGNGVTISTVDFTADAQIDRITIRANSADKPGSVLATFTYSSSSGNIYSYSGTFTTTAGASYWLTFQSTKTGGAEIINASQTATDVSSFGMSSSGEVLSSLNSGSTWGSTSVNGYVYLKFQLRSASPALGTPQAPIISNITNTTLSVSATSATSNAVNYKINLYQSNGSTLVESKTVSTITTPTIFSNLSPGTTYKASVIANGDSTNYSNSLASPQSTATTTTQTSISITSANAVTYRSSNSLVANVVGGEGRVTFTVNGKKIPGCLSKPTVSLSATCTYRPSVRGSVLIAADFKPTNSSLSAARATKNVQVSNRNSQR